MARREFNENEIDFAAIETDLGRLAPPKLSLEQVLQRLHKRLVEQHAKGVTVAQMREVLAARGVEIGERSLRVFLEKGDLPRTRKGVAAALTRTAQAGESEDPF